MKEELFGFVTSKKISILKVRMSDINDIVRLYQRKTPEEREKLERNWKRMITFSMEDFSNVVFIIRDKCQHAIGMLETEKNNKENSFEVGIWIPNKAKQTTYLEHIRESFLEWGEEETSIDSISAIKVLKEITLYQVTVEK